MQDREKIDPADKRQYLSFIQGVINRMASNCTSLKTWLTPVLALLYGFAVQQHKGELAWIGIAFCLVFCAMDAMYLSLGRAYRHLYARAAKDQTALWDMSYDASDLSMRLYLRSLRSWSVLPFYGVMALGGVALAILAC
ncbi:MAG: hypothetical protein M3036_14590 [Bifidobacteriales bacterium]|nr:hypothetical protein [Bifidobacteriales bacterium]